VSGVKRGQAIEKADGKKEKANGNGKAKGKPKL
jgi:hypothetical protein